MAETPIFLENRRGPSSRGVMSCISTASVALSVPRSPDSPTPRRRVHAADGLIVRDAGTAKCIGDRLEGMVCTISPPRSYEEQKQLTRSEHPIVRCFASQAPTPAETLAPRVSRSHRGFGETQTKAMPVLVQVQFYASLERGARIVFTRQLAMLPARGFYSREYCSRDDCLDASLSTPRKTCTTVIDISQPGEHDNLGARKPCSRVGRIMRSSIVVLAASSAATMLGSSTAFVAPSLSLGLKARPAARSRSAARRPHSGGGARIR